MFDAARRGSRSAVLVGLGAVWATTVVSVGVVVAIGGTVREEVVGPASSVFTLVAGVAAVLSARRPALDRRTRKAWRVLAAAYGVSLMSNVGFAVHASFPGPGDYLRLGFAALMLLGLLRFPGRATTHQERKKLGLDVVVVLAGGFMVLWYTALGPAVTQGELTLHFLWVAVAYPVTDLAVLFGAVTALLKWPARASRGPLLAMALGLVALLAVDVDRSRRLLFAELHSTAATTSGEWVGILSAYALFAAAAVVQCRATAPKVSTAGAEHTAGVSLFPYSALVIGYGLLLVVAARSPLFPWGGLVIGAVVMTGSVAARQWIALHENQTLARTDHLTGLATRRHLRAELDEALHESVRRGERTGFLLIDLDRFKEVNDSLGHEAGDAVLVAFADVLRRSLPLDAVAGRLGGDEFAVVLPLVGSAADAVSIARRIAVEAEKPLVIAGHELCPHASVGVALSEPGLAVTELMHRADLAMYLAKDSPSPAWRLFDQHSIAAAAVDLDRGADRRYRSGR